MFAGNLARCVALSAVCCCAAPPLNAATYHFVNISRNLAVNSLHGASINNYGTVAFSAYGPEDDTHSLYSGRGGGINKLASATGEAAVWSAWEPDINRNGTVAFKANVEAPGKYEPFAAGIFTARPKGVTTVALYDNATFLERAAINDKGQVASVVTWYTGVSSVVTYSPKRTIATFSNPANSFGEPDINNAGVVAFPVLVGSEQRIVTSTGGKQTVKATTKGTDFDSLLISKPRINNRGDVAFQTNLKSGGQGVFLVDDQGVHTIADSSGPFHFLYDPAINNLGQVAFSAWLDGGQEGIFIGPDPVADRVIAEGDPLDGSIVTHVGAGSRALNDSGQIAFYAYLADGREGIYRADPAPSLARAVAVPEPSALVLIITACAGLCILRPKTCGSAARLSRPGHSFSQ